MLFRRRRELTFRERMRELLYPRKGFWRGLSYGLQRLRRIPGSPESIALGFAVGTFISFSPFYTMHIPLTLAIAWVLGGSLVGGFAGTFVANGLTTPPIALLAITTGDLVLGRGGGGIGISQVTDGFARAFGGLWDVILALFGPSAADFSALLPFLTEIFLPYLVGGTLTGLVAAIAGYYACLRVVASYQARRLRKLEQRAATRPRSNAASRGAAE